MLMVKLSSMIAFVCAGSGAGLGAGAGAGLGAGAGAGLGGVLGSVCCLPRKLTPLHPVL